VVREHAPAVARGGGDEIVVAQQGSWPLSTGSAASDPAEEADIPPVPRGESLDGQGFRSFV